MKRVLLKKKEGIYYKQEMAYSPVQVILDLPCTWFSSLSWLVPWIYFELYACYLKRLNTGSRKEENVFCALSHFSRCHNRQFAILIRLLIFLCFYYKPSAFSRLWNFRRMKSIFISHILNNQHKLKMEECLKREFLHSDWDHWIK